MSGRMRGVRAFVGAWAVSAMLRAFWWDCPRPLGRGRAFVSHKAMSHFSDGPCGKADQRAAYRRSVTMRRVLPSTWSSLFLSIFGTS